MAETPIVQPSPISPESTPAADPAFNPAVPETRQTPVNNPPDGKSDTISVTYHPLSGDPDETEAYGKTFVAGEAVEVPAKHADKIRGNPSFAVEGEKTFGDDKRDEDEPEEQEEASFDENVARERAEEYLNTRPQFTSSTPGDAERVARAQEAARELQAALADPDSDKPKRGPGRPRKAV